MRIMEMTLRILLAFLCWFFCLVAALYSIHWAFLHFDTSRLWDSPRLWNRDFYLEIAAMALALALFAAIALRLIRRPQP